MSVNTKPDIHQLVICANVFVIDANRVLMIRRSLEKNYLPGYIQPIGGKVDLNEDPLTAAKRELKEEAGIEVANLKLKAIVTEIKTKKDSLYSTNWQIFHFVGEYKGESIIGNEEGELIWIDKKELKNEKLADSIMLLLDKLLDGSSKVAFAKYTYGDNNTLLNKDIEEI
jgi:8-oxo-dGTP diphosphatase